MAKLFTLFLVLGSFSMVSQNTTYSLQLFYNINESLSEKNFGRVDSFCTALPLRPVNITITGYADFLHSNTYNLTLSQKRADLIKDYLLKRPGTKQFTILNCTGLGESASKDNRSTEGEPSRRRVDLVAEVQNTATVSTTGVKRKPKITTTQAATAPEQEISPTAKFEELKEGESFELEGLSFEPGRHIMLKSSVPVLKKLLKTLEDNPTLKIEIQGHICCIIDSEDALDYDEHNYKLSYNRAKAVYDYLIKNGIDAERLGYRGYGHSRPRVKELNAALEQVNRRVEVRVIEN